MKVRSHQEEIRYRVNLSIQQPLLCKKLRFIGNLYCLVYSGKTGVYQRCFLHVYRINNAIGLSAQRVRRIVLDVRTQHKFIH